MPALNRYSLDSSALSGLEDQRPPTASILRHLGLPAGAQLDEQLEQLVQDAQGWYERRGDPWILWRQVAIESTEGAVVALEQAVQLNSALLSDGLASAQASALVVVAVSAGSVVDERIDQLWREDRVDEAMFLNAVAIATVEHLRRQVGSRLRQELGPVGAAVLPHYSPGYDGWDLADQARLYHVLGEKESSLTQRLELLESGALRPAKSTLAAYGVVPQADVPNDVRNFWSCRLPAKSDDDGGVGYAFPKKALIRWRDQRLKILVTSDQQLLATFHFDGSTCNNMGVPLAFDYEVHLKRDESGDLQILRTTCEPAANCAGYQSMCAYLDAPHQFMTNMRSHQPLTGLLLRDALRWSPATSPAGCLCTRASQDHKWRIVLQTLYFALEEHE